MTRLDTEKLVLLRMLDLSTNRLISSKGVQIANQESDGFLTFQGYVIQKWSVPAL
jgi:hypothetical protein